MAETKLSLKEINLKRYLAARHKDMLPEGVVQTRSQSRGTVSVLFEI